MPDFKRYLITAALPYANGPLHFGHLAGVYIPADIYARHRKLQGHPVKFICGSDEHGVAIMLSAEKEGLPYREYVDKWHQAHKELFSQLEIEFDFFGRTSEKYHETETLEWFQALYDKGLIGLQTEKQLYCIEDKKFLPDRFVEGTCYKCGYEAARGDECPNCGEWIDPIRLKNPVSKISGSRNIEVRETQNYFLLLTKLEAEYRKVFAEKKSDWRKLVLGFIQGLLDQGLVDRCISRDLDWGIRVPLPEAKGKRLYVWFDAPIGYVSNLRQHLQEIGSKDDYRRDWYLAKDVELSHFIGKDNIIFHALIFPMMALGTGFIKVVDSIPANEFLNLEGKQFSKSAGWYIDAAAALKDFGITPLRFYLCSVIPETSDSNFSWDTFESNYNELRNKVGNFIHRSLSFLHKNFPNGLSKDVFANILSDEQTQQIFAQVQKVIKHLDHCEFIKAQDKSLYLGQLANEFFHAAAPWAQIKTGHANAAPTMARSLLYIIALSTVLEPFIPTVAQKLQSLFANYLSPADFKRLYRGEYEFLSKSFTEGFKLPAAPEVLFPPIDPLLLKSWKEKLKK